jgi:hypothetical protein
MNTTSTLNNDAVDTAGANSAQEATQTQQPRMRVRLDESKLDDTYINTFRTSTSLEEVMLDVGTNGSRIAMGPEGKPQQEVLMRFDHRLVMNYFTAKRLAIGLGRLVREYEARMGELELDARKRLADAQDGIGRASCRERV